MFSFDFSAKEPRLLSPLTLAFIGDAVWEIYVRSRIIADMPDMSVNKLHRYAISFEKAHGQCIALNSIYELLNENEISIFKRGRNANQHTTAKNATLSDYKHATGFEAVLGYVYMCGNIERLEQLMDLSYNALIDTTV